jgi:hypothetical protein
MLKPLMVALLLSGCGNTAPERHVPAPPVLAAPAAAGSAYDFAHPASTYVVPAQLQELSGQTLVGEGQLACIEDETGDLHFYNLRTQRLDSTVQFGPKGDYEDVARVPGGYLVLRSDGTLFKRNGRVTTTYATGLSAANEPEGLAYDAASQTLLVACKSEPGAGLAATKRAVYRLNPTTYHIESKPAYVLDIAAILARSPDAARPGKAAKKTGQLSQFAPSAVAVHPRTRHVFVLSARGNDLVELDPQGRLVAAQTLDPALFPQPEGLAFAPNGDLFVSSEAGSKKGQGRLYRFSETPSQP